VSHTGIALSVQVTIKPDTEGAHLSTSILTVILGIHVPFPPLSHSPSDSRITLIFNHFEFDHYRFKSLISRFVQLISKPPSQTVAGNLSKVFWRCTNPVPGAFAHSFHSLWYCRMSIKIRRIPVLISAFSVDLCVPTENYDYMYIDQAKTDHREPNACAAPNYQSSD
jgi:hypothetical protein